ncbi:MAG: DUF4838 domain-containing protein, partial [Flavobacterium sp.]|nr:DUF4838 domain-containing protein [Flavobacterium sp.]
AIAFDHYVVKAALKDNVEEVNYLYNHFKNRAAEGIVLKQGQDKISSDESKVQFIDVAIDKDLNNDYEIIKKDNKLTLKANSKKTLYWLYYQYFQALSENDSKIKGEDLPPAIVNFKESKKVKFVFNYREPYLKANMAKDYDVIVNTNNVENDWGIWGHQLFNFVNKNPKNDFYSTVNGQLNKNQLCFGKPAMYDYLENFVIENFGENASSHQKFVICPADNDLVCTCIACAKLGNTKANASFSVIALVNKLAIRFPNHQFFTIDYITVKTPPTKPMPKNSGIIISSINIPRKVNMDSNNPSVKEFASKVDNWHKVCPTVYVWDYISNFDDYLTPFATLSVCKTNFEFYKKLNINGIFANGAGYDYSTFNEVHTYVLAALMLDSTLDVNLLVNRFCKYYYGKCGQLVADYINGLENVMQTKKVNLELYSGVKKMTATYLNKKEFFDFYNATADMKIGETDEIDYKLSQLHTGLIFSAMQINLASGFDEQFGFAKNQNNQLEINNDFKNEYDTFTEKFKTKDIFIVREHDGNVTNYLKDVKTEIIDANLQKNLLDKNDLKVTSPLDEDYTDASLLTDGIPGLPFDYHSGWLIVSTADLTAEINGIKETGLFRFKLNFLLDEHLKMRAPEKIEVAVNNAIVKTIMPTIEMSVNAKKVILETSINLNSSDKVKIKIYRNKTYKKFACDEIYLYK